MMPIYAHTLGSERALSHLAARTTESPEGSASRQLACYCCCSSSRRRSLRVGSSRRYADSYSISSFNWR